MFPRPKSRRPARPIPQPIRTFASIGLDSAAYDDIEQELIVTFTETVANDLKNVPGGMWITGSGSNQFYVPYIASDQADPSTARFPNLDPGFTPTGLSWVTIDEITAASGVTYTLPAGNIGL